MRHIILEQLGWRLFRIWSTDFFLDPEASLAALDAKLKEQLEADRRAETEVRDQAGNAGSCEADLSDDDLSEDDEREDEEALSDDILLLPAPPLQLPRPAGLARPPKSRTLGSGGRKTLGRTTVRQMLGPCPLPLPAASTIPIMDRSSPRWA